jgi:hypothetical protein
MPVFTYDYAKKFVGMVRFFVVAKRKSSESPETSTALYQPDVRNRTSGNSLMSCRIQTTLPAIQRFPGFVSEGAGRFSTAPSLRTAKRKAIFSVKL